MRYSDILEVTRIVEETCNCSIHNNEHLVQIDALLKTNNKPVRILVDNDGFHVAIGKPGMLGDFNLVPPPISEPEMIQLLLSEL